MLTWVALLRGINVGGHRTVSMPVLRAALDAAGCHDVRTYVNSGNVVLRSDLTDPQEVSALVRGVVAAEFGFDVPVMVRTAGQLAELLAWNPFPAAAADRPQLVQVFHLAAEPPAEVVSEALTVDVAPDQLAFRGREAVAAYAQSSRNSPVDVAIRRMGVEATARNWRTLTALSALSAPADA